jgi:hypothetical protein
MFIPDETEAMHKSGLAVKEILSVLVKRSSLWGTTSLLLRKK